MSLAEIRINLILLGVIFGVSAFLFLGRSMLTPSAVNDVPADTRQTDSLGSNQSADHNPVPDAVPTDSAPAENPSIVEPTEPPVTLTPLPTVKPEQTTNPAPALTVKPANAIAFLTPGKPAVVKPANTVPAPVKPPPVRPVPVAAVGAPPPERPVKHRGTLIFVFDDAGNNLKQLEPFLKLPFPCTIAVMPGLRYSKEAARLSRAAGKEVILHQPMQAINLSMDPGPGAIRKGMGADQIRTVIRANLAEIGPVVGINNHEGSLITADRPSMAAVLEVVREKRIYFLDSRTNAKTVAPALARENNMKIWERAVFLDNSQDKSSIIEAMNNGMKIAERKGAAIMIGHIWSNDLANILTEMYPELASQGFSLSTIAQIAISGEIDE